MRLLNRIESPIKLQGFLGLPLLVKKDYKLALDPQPPRVLTKGVGL